MSKNFIFILLALFLAGCASIYNPATGVEEMALVDTAAEVNMGQRMAYQVARQFPLSRDPDLNRRLKEIGANIARVSDRQDLAYNFYVIRGREINAFTLPGGFIFVFSGLMDKTTDDELAAVLAHEAGHVAARHPAKKMEINMGYDLLDSLIFGRSTEAEMRQVMNIFFNVMAAGYEREDELMADRLSVRYAKRAGYDPCAAISFMRKLQSYDRSRGSPVYHVLSSHPDFEDRIKNVEIELERIKDEGFDKREQQPLSPPLETAPSPHYRNVKVCPRCAVEYPLHFNYCTSDGTKLE